MSQLLTVTNRIWESLNSWALQSVLWYPLLLSLLSASIFWLTFSVYPNWKRSSIIRPVIHADKLNIRQNLFSIFNQILGIRGHSAYIFQNKIRSGNLSRTDILFGLQNKCLNNTYLYDDEIKTKMVVIGDKIYQHSEQIDYLIDKILHFSDLLSPNEILLLEKIRLEIRRYDFLNQSHLKNGVTVSQGRAFFAPVSNLHYRINNFEKLYELFVEFDNLLYFDAKPTDDTSFLDHIQFLYARNKHEECKELIRKNIRRYMRNEGLARNYYACCERELGNMDSYYDEIATIYEARPHKGNLSSNRNFLIDVLEDKKLEDVLLRSHSEEEIEKLCSSIKREDKLLEQYINSNLQLSKYFNAKDRRLAVIENYEV